MRPHNYNRNNWYVFAEDDQISPSVTAQAGQAAIKDPNDPQAVAANATNRNKPDYPKNDDGPGLADAPSKDDDVTSDPTHPDIGEDETEHETKDFEKWRGEFVELSQSADTKDMLDSIRPWVAKPNLEPPQAKFVSDNYQILLYREDATVDKAMKETRGLIRKNIDRTYPGTSIMQHLTATIEKFDPIHQVIIKLSAAYGLKAELHRKFLASLLGATQWGGGNRRFDLIYAENAKPDGLSVDISTRYATEFGQINIGRWALKTTDPEEILSDSEMERLNDGSPDEKRVLRQRITLESMAKEFKRRSFLVHVSRPDGSVVAIGWDLGESLSSAYQDGRIVVRGNTSDQRSAMISNNGDIVPLIDTDVLYVQDTGNTDDYGNPESVEVPLLGVRDCTLYVTADYKTLQNAGATMNGLFVKDIPFNGNPSDLVGIRGSLPNLKSILNKEY